MTKRNVIHFFVVSIFVVMLSFFIYSKLTAYNRYWNIQYVKIADIILKVDLATTREELWKGLTGRNELQEWEGMLFIFNYPGKYLFWMKDMTYAIDMIWIGDDGRIVYIEKDAKPGSDSKTYGPDKVAKYVLEVVAGFSEKHNLMEGDSVEFAY